MVCDLAWDFTQSDCQASYQSLRMALYNCLQARDGRGHTDMANKTALYIMISVHESPSLSLYPYHCKLSLTQQFFPVSGFIYMYLVASITAVHFEAGWLHTQLHTLWSVHTWLQWNLITMVTCSKVWLYYRGLLSWSQQGDLTGRWLLHNKSDSRIEIPGGKVNQRFYVCFMCIVCSCVVMHREQTLLQCTSAKLISNWTFCSTDPSFWVELCYRLLVPMQG